MEDAFHPFCATMARTILNDSLRQVGEPFGISYRPSSSKSPATNLALGTSTSAVFFMVHIRLVETHFCPVLQRHHDLSSLLVLCS